MESNFKRAMKLIWGNKRTRATFGCGLGFGVSESGFVYLGILVLGMIPIVASFFGKYFSNKTLMSLVGISACACGVTINFLGQRMFSQYGKLGKYFGSLPLAKYVMTKGYFFSTWILWSCGFLLTSATYGISVVMGVAPLAGFHVLLFFFGVIIFIDGVCFAFCHKNNPEVDRFLNIGAMVTMIWGINFVKDMDSLVEDGISLKSALLWFVAFMVVGSFLLYFFSQKRFKERSTVVLTALPEEN